MKIKFFLIIISTLFYSISCSDKYDSINGHWDLINSELIGGAFISSLDITDSVTHGNQFDLSGNVVYNFPRTFQSRKILPINDLDFTDSYYVENDTLVITKEELKHKQVYKYVRSDIKNCIIQHRYSNIFIEIDLPKNNDATMYEQRDLNHCPKNIFLGKLIKGTTNNRDILSAEYPDSVFIQVNDGLINFNDISTFVNRSIHSCIEEKSVFYLHADRNVSLDYIDKLLQRIPDYMNIEIKRVSLMDDGDIGFQSIELNN